MKIEDDVGWALENRRDVTRALKILDNLQQKLDSIKADAFRRGEIENVIGTHLRLEKTFPDIYSEVWKRRPRKLASSVIDDYVVCQVSRWQAAMFQTLLAMGLKGVPGLDPVHPVELAHKGFFHHMFGLGLPGDLDLDLPESAACPTNNYDVPKALTASNIVEFRTGDETGQVFEDYLRLRQLATEDVHMATLVQHVYDSFLPKLHEFAKKKGLSREQEEWHKTLEAHIGPSGTVAISALGRPIVAFIYPVLSPILTILAKLPLELKWAFKQSRWDAYVIRQCPSQYNYYIPSTVYGKLPTES